MLVKTALYNIIKNHTVISYDGLWTAFQYTDKKSNGKVWDMYSDKPAKHHLTSLLLLLTSVETIVPRAIAITVSIRFPRAWFNDASPCIPTCFTFTLPMVM